MQPIRASSDGYMKLKEPSAKRQMTKIEEVSLKTLGEPDLELMLSFLSDKIISFEPAIKHDDDLDANLVLREKRTGYFKVFYSNRDRYEGDFVNGQPHGQGKSFYSNGKVSYEGGYLRNNAHGKGREYSTNGNLLYSGDFAFNEYHGFGISYGENGAVLHSGYWYSGRMYVGQTKNNKPDGEGALFYSNGAVLYRGQWLEGVPHGDGVEYESTKQAKVGTWFFGFRYEGSWKDMLPQGYGEMFDFHNDPVYFGTFHAGRFHGQGKRFLNGKLLYAGNFHLGKYNGLGKLYDMHGRIICNGRWINDEFTVN